MKRLLPLIFIIGSIFCSYTLFQDLNKPGTENKKVSGAYNSLSFWAQARAYPFNEIPEGKFYQAFEKKGNIVLNKSSELKLTESWTTIGPHNTGGRTNALAFNPQNPNTIYAGSASGGLWVSYSGGVGINAWHYVPTNIPILGVSSIAIVPGDSNTIYIGTGEVYNYDAAGTGAAYRNTRGTYGAGILKTTDGGSSWIKSLDWSYSDQHGVWDIEINPLNHNTIWAATTEGTFRSFDAGDSWQLVNDVVMAMDLIINPVDTNIIITGNGDFQSAGYGIYRTSDDGNTWSQITSGLPATFRGKIQLEVYKANPDIMFASIGDGFELGEGASWLCRSTDAGLTWTIRTTTDYSQHQGWYSHDVAVDQWNENNLIVIGIAVWKSTNGGLTIMQKSDGGLTLGRPPIGGQEGGTGYTHADAHCVIQHPTQENIFYIGTDGGVFRTTDLGETFQSCNGRYQTTQFYNGTSSSQTDSMFAMGGLQDNSTVIYDGSLAWTRNIGGDGCFTAINSVNDNILFGSWQYLNILKSTNRGVSFSSSVSPPNSNITCFVAPYVIEYGNSNIMYAGREKIFKSTNGGNNWTATNGNLTLDSNPALAMAISYSDPNKLYVTTAPYVNRSGIFVTSNAGTNWTNITGSLPDRFPADISVDPNDDNIVYVTFYGFGTPHVFKSTNSGTDWNDINDNLPDIPTPAVIVDPDNSNHVYVGTDVGVFVSTDGGGNWQDFNDGLPHSVQAMDLQICTVNNVLRVMTHGNGVYERKLLSTIITNNENENTVVSSFRLEQNYPNPFNPVTSLQFTVSKLSFINLKVYDVLGNEIESLVNKELSPGTHEVKFDGSGLTSGTYFYRLEVGNYVETKKMLLIK